MSVVTLRRAAGFSRCGRYRYWLTRTWDAARPAVCWLMLHPSTADAARDDPTIRRCMGLARRWGHGGIVVINLFAWRATDPAELARAADPVGPANDRALRQRARGLRLIAAWGCQGKLLGRADAALRLLGGRRLECLGVTAAGQPRHPLYVPGDVVPVAVRPRAESMADLSALLAGVESGLDATGGVAQLVRVPDCRSGGCGFESRRPR